MLVIDDTETIRRHVIDFLRSQNVFDRYFEASDGISGLKVLIEDYSQIDLVLCDLEMPGIDGFKFLDIKHKTKPVENAVTMLGQLSKDSSFQIDSLRLAAALATKLGHRDEFRNGAANRFKAQPPQLAGLYEGIIEGMTRSAGK